MSMLFLVAVCLCFFRAPGVLWGSASQLCALCGVHVAAICSSLTQRGCRPCCPSCLSPLVSSHPGDLNGLVASRLQMPSARSSSSQVPWLHPSSWHPDTVLCLHRWSVPPTPCPQPASVAPATPVCMWARRDCHPPVFPSPSEPHPLCSSFLFTSLRLADHFNLSCLNPLTPRPKWPSVKSLWDNPSLSLPRQGLSDAERIMQPWRPLPPWSQPPT